MEKIIIDKSFLEKGIAPVYSKYPNQFEAQPAYIELDTEGYKEGYKGIISADYSGEIGNAIPASVWNNRTVRFSIPPYTSGSAILRVIEELMPLFEQAIDQYDDVWDGNNWVGIWNKDVPEGVQPAIEELYNLFEYGDLFDYSTDYVTVADTMADLYPYDDDFLNDVQSTFEDIQTWEDVSKNIERLAQWIIDNPPEDCNYLPYYLDFDKDDVITWLEEYVLPYILPYKLEEE